MGKKPQVIKKMVTLKVYKGSKLSYNEDNSVQNDTQLIKTQFNTNEWRCLMGSLISSGYCKVEVLNVKDMEDEFSIVSDIEDVISNVKDSFSKVIKKELTPEQKEIEALKLKLDAFMKQGTKEVVVSENKEDATKEYTDKTGKKPFHSWDIATIKEKQAEFLKIK